MTNSEIIKDVKENFKRLNAHKNNEVKPLLNALQRSIMRLKVSDKKDNLYLLKISADLKSAEESEAQFFTLNNPEIKTPKYSDSFYESVNVLKEELLLFLTKL